MSPRIVRMLGVKTPANVPNLPAVSLPPGIKRCPSRDLLVNCLCLAQAGEGYSHRDRATKVVSRTMAVDGHQRNVRDTFPAFTRTRVGTASVSI